MYAYRSALCKLHTFMLRYFSVQNLLFGYIARSCLDTAAAEICGLVVCNIMFDVLYLLTLCLIVYL